MHKNMLNFRRPVFIILAAISITGIIAIPFGDPQLVDRAIILELSFIALTLLSLKGYGKVLYVCIPLAVAVMIGNSLAPPHVQIMTTFSKPFNAVILITGGYILQGALIIASSKEIIDKQRSKKATTITGRRTGMEP